MRKITGTDSTPHHLSFKMILCGLGGQGVVFLTRLIAKTAISLEYHVIVSETHGMSQRGGSVISHLKIGHDKAPLIQMGTADAMLSLDADEAVRNMSFLRKGGTCFINSKNGVHKEVEPHLKRLDIQIHCIPASRMAVEIGSAAVANVILASFSTAFSVLPMNLESLEQTLKDTAKRGLEINLQALDIGFQTGRQMI
jgi:indolepyruvate ferredoxin oxidoreductase beta subunit